MPLLCYSIGDIFLRLFLPSMFFFFFFSYFTHIFVFDIIPFDLPSIVELVFFLFFRRIFVWANQEKFYQAISLETLIYQRFRMAGFVLSNQSDYWCFFSLSSFSPFTTEINIFCVDRITLNSNCIHCNLLPVHRASNLLFLSNKMLKWKKTPKTFQTFVLYYKARTDTDFMAKGQQIWL